MKVCIFIILYIFSISHVLCKEVKIDNIVAIVNDQIILNSDVNKIFILLKKEGKDFRTPFKSNLLKEKIIQKLILDELILQEAKKMNVVVTEKQISNIIQNIALKKNMSVTELKNYILSYDSYDNFSYKNYIKNLEKILKIKIVQDYEMSKRVHVSEREVNFLFKSLVENNKKFKKVNLSYILLPILKNSSHNIVNIKKKIADSIVLKLKQDYDFEKIYTECENNSMFLVKKMFWMTFLDVKNMIPNRFDILEKGQIVGPFLGKEGFYIIKINDICNKQENILTEFHIQHYLIKPSVIMSNEESKNNIFDIYKNIQKGVYSFDYVVKNLSHDFYSSHKNGDLGWISSNFFNSNFKEILLNLKKNEISKPIKSNLGWHIIKLLDKRRTDQFYNFQKKQSYNILFLQKTVLEKKHWIEDLKKFSYIKII